MEVARTSKSQIPALKVRMGIMDMANSVAGKYLTIGSKRILFVADLVADRNQQDRAVSLAE